MAVKQVVMEVESFREYLRSDKNEDTKTPLLYPLFKKLYGDRFRIESDSQTVPLPTRFFVFLSLQKNSFNDHSRN